MAYEGLGGGYSSGIQPDYASNFNRDQQQYAQQFADYTNPFLNARGVQSEILPWQQQALAQKTQAAQQSYQQGMLGIEQQRQNLAQTAQETMLPLQAKLLSAQATNMQADASRMNFIVDQQTRGAAELPSFAQDLTNAKTPADVDAAVARNAEAMATQQGTDLANRAYTRLGRVVDIQNTASAQAARGYGANDATNPKYADMSPSDYQASLTKMPGETDEAFGMRQTVQPGAFAQAQATRTQQTFLQNNAMTLAAAKGQHEVQAAELRNLASAAMNPKFVAELAAQGMTPYDYLEHQQPGLGAAAFAALKGSNAAFVADPNAVVGTAPSPFPASTQAAVLKQYMSVDPKTATPQEEARANALLAAVMPGVAQQMGVASQTDPAVISSLRNVQAQIDQAQSVIDSADPSSKSYDPTVKDQPRAYMGFGDPTGPSPYQKAQSDLPRLYTQREAILNGVKPAQQSGAGTPQASDNQTNFTPSDFGTATNSFINGSYNPTDMRPIQVNPSTGEVNANLPALAASGNPATASAMEQNPATLGIRATPGQQATAQRSVMKIASTPQASQKPAQKSFPQPKPEDVAYLAQNRSPTTIQRFEQTFGPGSAMKALQAFASTTPKNPATAAPVQ